MRKNTINYLNTTKKWLNNDYLNYADLTELEYSNRTNNYLESFHHVLNQTLKVYHP